MRLILTLCVLFSACAPAPPPAAPARIDASKAPWYPETTTRLASINKEAAAAFAAGDGSRTAALIKQGQPLSERLLLASNPTLAAMEAVSDLDDLYGRMLLIDRRYGWACIVLQKNLVRWTLWRPQTEETARRKKQAQSAIAECDRKM